MVIAAMKLKDAYSLEKSYDKSRQHTIKQRHYFGNKGLSSQGYGFSSGQLWIENWTIKKLSTKELIFLNCGVGEDSGESLGPLQGDSTNPS